MARFAFETGHAGCGHNIDLVVDTEGKDLPSVGSLPKWPPMGHCQEWEDRADERGPMGISQSYSEDVGR